MNLVLPPPTHTHQPTNQPTNQRPQTLTLGPLLDPHRPARPIEAAVAENDGRPRVHPGALGATKTRLSQNRKGIGNLLSTQPPSQLLMLNLPMMAGGYGQASALLAVI